MQTLRTAILLLVFAAAAQAARYESESSNYALVIESDGIAYQVQVTQRASNQILLDERVVAEKEKPATATKRVNGLELRVRIQPLANALSATLEVSEGGRYVDSIDTVWDTAGVVFHAAGARRIGGDVKAPVVVDRAEPHYTDEARQARVNGIVIVQAVVDKGGRVRDAVVLKGLPYGLSESALDAMRQWRFTPSTLDGEPVDVIFNLTVNFKVH